MNRRHFLSTLSAGAVSAAFLRFTFAEGRGGDRAAAARKLAVESLARAKENGKPLLVLVIPSEPQFVWTRGHLFGTWLDHADDALLADLALFEVACVPISALEGSSIRGLEDAKNPVMLLVETHETEPRAIAIDGEVPQSLAQDVTAFAAHGESFADIQKRATAAIRERDALVSKWLRDAVKIDERLSALADQADAALTDAQRTAVAEHAAEPTKIDGALLLRAAAVLRRAAQVDTKLPAAAITRAIAKAAAATIQTAPPSGALWAKSSGCGFSLEDPAAADDARDGGVACGMGFVPDEGKRFLYFLVQRAG